MDIDIDVPSTFKAHECFPNSVYASMVKDGRLIKHPVGTYFQTIPTDPITGLSSIPYEDAETLGFMKIDFLHLTLLDSQPDKQTVRELANKEPKWEILQDEAVVTKLFQIGNHFELVASVRPTSVLELADCIALIRPNKRRLLGRYLRDREGTREALYTKEHASDYRKSHAVAYALNIVIQMNSLNSTHDSLDDGYL